MEYIPILQSYTDYVSNPKCDEWKNLLSVYRVHVVYQCVHIPTGTNTVNQMRVKHISHAHRIINHWNSIPTSPYKYTLIEDLK